MSAARHPDAWSQWQAALGGARLHHAWLLAGPQGLGKGSFADEAARALVGAEGDGAHPDILHLTHLPKDDKEQKKKDDGKPFELKRNITIDQVRAVQRRITTRPTLGDRRAIIVEPADDMERGAANALLKSLEEPPAGTYFLLVSHRPGRLLPTIRSRCRTLRFAPLEDDAVARLVAEMAPDADRFVRDAAVAAAAGSPGAAERFIALDLAPLHAIMVRLLSDPDPQLVLRGQLAAAMGQRPTRERQLAAIDLARSVLAGAMRETGPADLGKLADAYAAVVRLGEQAPTYNFDPGLLVMEIGSLLASAAADREAA